MLLVSQTVQTIVAVNHQEFAMRLLIILLLLNVTSTHAAVYKCVDAKGNISYLSSKCRHQNKSGKEIDVDNKQPLVSKEEKSMRTKDEKTRRKLMRSFKATEKANNKHRKQMLATDKKYKKISAYKKSQRQYHEDKIDTLERKKKTKHTFKAKRSLDKRIEKHEEMKKQFY